MNLIIVFNIFLKIILHLQLFVLDLYIKFNKFIYSKKNHEIPIKENNIFPIGLWKINEIDLKKVKDCGFNVIFPYSIEISKLEEMQSHNIYTFQYVDNNKIQYHQSILGYYLFDEPELKKNEYEYSLKSISVKVILKKLKKFRKDINKPKIISFSGVNSPILLLFLYKNLRKYSNIADINCLNTYPISRFLGPLILIAYGNSLLKIFNPNKTIFSNIQVFKWYQSPKSVLPWIWHRYPTIRELRVMVYLSLSTGSKGILFFASGLNYIPFDPVQGLFYNKGLLNELTKIIKELKILIPFLKYSSVVNLKSQIRPSYFRLKALSSRNNCLIIFIINFSYLQGFTNSLFTPKIIQVKMRIPNIFENNLSIFRFDTILKRFNHYDYNKNNKKLKFQFNNINDVNIFLISFKKVKK